MPGKFKISFPRISYIDHILINQLSRIFPVKKTIENMRVNRMPHIYLLQTLLWLIGRPRWMPGASSPSRSEQLFSFFIKLLKIHAITI